MTPRIATAYWPSHAGNERALLTRHLNALALQKPYSVNVAGSQLEAAMHALANGATISLITLFMLWAVINPL